MFASSFISRRRLQASSGGPRPAEAQGVKHPLLFLAQLFSDAVRQRSLRRWHRANTSVSSATVLQLRHGKTWDNLGKLLLVSKNLTLSHVLNHVLNLLSNLFHLEVTSGPPERDQRILGAVLAAKEPLQLLLNALLCLTTTYIVT